MNSNVNRPIGRNVANTGARAASAGKGTIAKGLNTTRNFAARSYGRFKDSSVTAKIISGIILVFIIIVVVYVIIWALNRSKESLAMSPYLVTTPVNAHSEAVAKKTHKVPDPVEGINFSYSFWMYIADWNYKFGKWKNIFVKGNPASDRRAPGLWLYPKTNALHARINTYADANEGCDLKNIPLQKWVHIVYVLNNRTVDMYVDGKLERSCVLRGVPVLNKDPVHLVQDGGFFGQLARFQYFAHSLSPTDVSRIYSYGPFMDTHSQPAEEESN